MSLLSPPLCRFDYMYILARLAGKMLRNATNSVKSNAPRSATFILDPHSVPGEELHLWIGAIF